MFLIINNEQAELKSGVPDLKTMQNLVGIPGEQAYVEFISKQFSDPNIDLVCDDSFQFKSLQPTCMTSKGQILYGQILVVGLNYIEGQTIALTSSQIEIVKRELKIISNIAGISIISPISEFLST